MRSKGISPVIATVIIVAVAIAIAIAVAFWLTGIVGIFTGRVEQLEIVAARTDYDSGTGKYTITVIVKNSGTSPATIDGVFITPTNIAESATASCSVGNSGPSINDVNTGSDCKVEPGGSVKVTIEGISGTAGQSVEIKLHSAGGKEYPKLVVLP